MTHPDYQPDDFGAPLSDDAAIMLKFVNAQKRRIRRLRAAVAPVFAAGFLMGVFALGIFQRIT